MVRHLFLLVETVVQQTESGGYREDKITPYMNQAFVVRRGRLDEGRRGEGDELAFGAAREVEKVGREE
jgi:hypothetical protein